MSNLAMYQDITTRAKELGGVANLIKDIERGVAPKYLGIGFVSGMAVTFGFAIVAVEIQDRLDRARVAQAEVERFLKMEELARDD